MNEIRCGLDESTVISDCFHFNELTTLSNLVSEVQEITYCEAYPPILLPTLVGWLISVSLIILGLTLEPDTSS